MIDPKLRTSRFSVNSGAVRRYKHSRNARKPLAAMMLVVGLVSVLRAPWADAPVMSLFCSLLGVLAGWFAYSDRPGDVLSPGKTGILLYSISFSIAPMIGGSLANYGGRYFGFQLESVLAMSSSVAVVGLVACICGYGAMASIGRRLSYGAVNEEFVIADRVGRVMIGLGAAIGLVSAICYVVLVTKGGGLQYFLNYSSGRADIFRGIFGGWFWGMMFSFAGYGLVASVLIRKYPWICFSAAIVMSAAFFAFQGRDLVVAPLFCWLTLYHYGHRRLSWRDVVMGVALLLVISAFVGAYRVATKTDSRDSTSKLVTSFAGSVGEEVNRVILQNVEQLDSLAIAVRYRQKGGEALGILGLTNWIEPIDRLLFDDSIPSIETGRFMDVLIYPEHQGWNTALSPSLVGELYICLGWVGVIVGMLCYGAVLAVLARWSDARTRSPVLFAAYPFVSFMVIKMVVDGTGQMFRLFVVMSVIAMCAFIIPSSWARRRGG